MKRVVITGQGAISPLGNTADALWEGLKTGKKKWYRCYHKI